MEDLAGLAFYEVRPCTRTIDTSPELTALLNSSTGPNEGTIRFFPDLLLSTAYIILRPFFSLAVDPAKVKSGEADIWDPKIWKFGK